MCNEHEHGGSPLDWLRDSIPGEPGLDYPILAAVQESAFTCEGLIFGGYYADPEQDCQVRDNQSPFMLSHAYKGSASAVLIPL